MKTLQSHPFQPGDKVRMKDPDTLPSCDRIAADHWNFNHLPRRCEVYTVRHSFIGMSGTENTPAIKLVGIHSILNRPDGSEWGFRASAFVRVNRRRDSCPPPPRDEIMPFSIDIPVPREVAGLLRFLHLENWVEPWCIIGDGTLESVTRRWEVKNPHQGLGVPLGAKHRQLAAAVATGDAETVTVPLSDFGWDDLHAIAAEIGITPQAWLQGVIGILAAKVERAQARDRRRR